MFGSKQKQDREERLDRLGRRLVRVPLADEAEVERAASSPFLYARVRARINAEQKRPEAGEQRLLVARVWRAVGVMGAAALLAVGSLWLTAPTGDSFSVEGFLGAGNARFEQVAFTDRDPITNDEVLSAIVADEAEDAK